MDGSFMDILRKKKESRFTRNNLSDGKRNYWIQHHPLMLSFLSIPFLIARRRYLKLSE